MGQPNPTTARVSSPQTRRLESIPINKWVALAAVERVAAVLRFKRCSATNGPKSLLQKGLLAYDSDESIVLHQRGVLGGLVFGHGTRGSGRPAAPGGSGSGAGTGPSMVTAGAGGRRCGWWALPCGAHSQAGTRVICRWLAKISITIPK